MFCENVKKIWMTSAQLKKFKKEDFLNLANWAFLSKLYLSSPEIQVLVELQKKLKQEANEFE